MKRTQIKRRAPLKRHMTLRVVGTSTVSDTKKEIQRVLREIVIARDGGCIFREFVKYNHNLYPVPPCNGYAKDGHLILQADHLITRGNSATYADTRLVVCVCKGHHGWKSLGGNRRKAQYDQIVRSLLPPERVALRDRCEQESWRPTRTYANDWRLQLAALEHELKSIKAAA